MNNKVHAGFVVDKAELRQVSFTLLRFLPVCIIPPMLQTHSLIFHRRHIILAINKAVK